jgi:hypothetical protein
MTNLKTIWTRIRKLDPFFLLGAVAFGAETIRLCFWFKTSELGGPLAANALILSTAYMTLTFWRWANYK